MVPADELRVYLQIVIRCAPDTGLPPEHVHDITITLGTNQQPLVPIGRDLVSAGALEPLLNRP